MADAIEIALSGIYGLMIGLLYFAGLWWTVCQFRQSKNAAAIYLTSLAIRLGLFLACLLFLVNLNSIL